MLHWLSHVLGLDNLSGPYYGFWSGFGSDLTEFALLAGVISIYRRHNCTVRGCLRIGRHPVEGTPYKTCHRHATMKLHKKIHEQHETDYPDQHRLLNKDK